MNTPSLRTLILTHVQRPEYHPVKPKTITKQLGLPPDLQKDVRKAVRKLVKAGKLAYGDKHLVLPVSAPAADAPQAMSKDAAAENTNRPAKKERSEQKRSKQERPKQERPKQEQPQGKSEKASSSQTKLVSGVFKRAMGGFGFVRPTGAPSRGRENDIYISRRKTHDAASGDIVEVRLSSKPGRGGRVQGEIVDIVERQTQTFVGVYSQRNGVGYVRIDGKIFSDPIYVGDAAAKGALAGDKVVLELIRFPSHAHEGEGVVTEVLGARGEPGVDTLSVIREFELPEEFPEDVLEDARRRAEAFDESIGADRLDLTHETIVTIDPVDARDFDDAISLEKNDRGNWRLGVHIADVAHFTPLKSALDREARNRSTSVYLPDRVIPMLPETISNHLASLQPDRVRYAKTAYIEFTPEGTRVSVEVHTSAIRSRRRFTYEEVDDYLNDAEPWREKLTPDVHALLGRMHELAMTLRKKRLARGAIELVLPEVKIDLDKQGRVSGAHVVENTESHQIIEEFMLAANEAVAEYLRERHLFFLRRVHDAPDPRKLEALSAFLKELGLECDQVANRFEVIRVLAETADSPLRYAVHYAILRSMAKAVYSPEDAGHFALASDCYCHFTSPIRRYPDLTIHRMLTALEQGRKPVQDLEAITILGEHCSNREQRAAAAERELVKTKLLTFLSKKIGQEIDAIVTGVEEFGIFVQGSELPAEGLVHINSLRDDTYDYDAKTHTLTGRRAGNTYRLGDMVRVEIGRVDVDRRQLDFQLVADQPPQPASPQSKAKRPRGQKKRGPR